VAGHIVNDSGAGWRETELAIIGGCAHSLNGSLTGLMLAAELGRMDNSSLPSEALDVIDQQAGRIGSEIAVLFTLRTLDSPLVELHDPWELARTSVTLCERLPAAAGTSIRITGTSDVVAVEVAGGPCVRALVLCIQTLAGKPSPAGRHDIELRLSRHGPEVRIEVASDGPSAPLPRAAEAVLAGDTGVRLLSLDGLSTLILVTPP
jgi:hypothetical protein